LPRNMTEGAGKGKRKDTSKTRRLGTSRNLPEGSYTDFVSAIKIS